MIEQKWRIGNQFIAGLHNEGNGPLIIGLHGFLDNAASLLPLAPYLTDYRFIAIDLPGHGKSSHRSADAHYHLLDYVQDLYHLCEQEKWQDFVLLGHSMGGIVGSIFAATFPEKITGLFSIDACGPLTVSAHKSAEQLRASVLSRMPKQRPWNQVDLDKAISARCAISDIPEEHAKSILERNLHQTESGQWYWSSDPKLRTKSSLRLTDEQAESFMRAIRCPVYFAAASNSFKKLSDTYPKRQAWFDNSQCEEFVGGHHIHMEKPDEIGPAIRAFVEHL